MADSYWRYNEARQPPPSSAIPSMPVKRPRPDYDGAGSHDLPAYFPREDERGGAMRGGARDTESINASYDRYLRSTQAPPYGGGGQPVRPMGGGGGGGVSGGGGMPGRPIEDPRVASIDHGPPLKDRSLGFGGGAGRHEISLPPDASSTLYVEGLPPNCTRREVAHIFRPFVGYKDVRLVSKESRHPGGDPLVLCFVDFLSPAHAATAMDALQGYKFDEHDRDSVCLRLQFARYPGARSGGTHRGKR